jgi:hypothetical protein
MCYLCPDTPVTHVSGLYTAAKKVTKESSFFLARSSDSVVTPQKDIGTQLESALNHPPRPLNTHVLRAPWLVKTISNDDSATYSSLGKPRQPNDHRRLRDKRSYQQMSTGSHAARAAPAV